MKHCDKCPHNDSCSILGECLCQRFGIIGFTKKLDLKNIVDILFSLEGVSKKDNLVKLSARKEELAALVKSTENRKGVGAARRSLIKRNYQLMAGVSKFMRTHETFLMAIIEMIHRYYYDNCFDVKTGKLMDTEEAIHVHNLHSKLVAANPNWRYKLKKKLDRYNAWEDTKALDIRSKPKADVLNPEVNIFYRD